MALQAILHGDTKQLLAVSCQYKKYFTLHVSIPPLARPAHTSQSLHLSWKNGAARQLAVLINGSFTSCNVDGDWCSVKVCIYSRKYTQAQGIRYKLPQIAKFMGPTWGSPGSCQPQMGPMWAPWALLSGAFSQTSLCCQMRETNSGPLSLWHHRQQLVGQRVIATRLREQEKILPPLRMP